MRRDILGQVGSRRQVLLGLAAAGTSLFASRADARYSEIWSARQAHDALLADDARTIDVRSREEWRNTGVGTGIWPISMHEDLFADRLFAAKAVAGGRTVGLICATGGRSAPVLLALRRAGYPGYADISEGMLGAKAGPGWIAAGLPVVSLGTALDSLPPDLA